MTSSWNEQHQKPVITDVGAVPGLFLLSELIEET